jgi:ssDNA thymidine ADP-ribosyltransferase, DarT
MLYAADHLVYVAILEIEPQVVYWQDTMFSNENATANSPIRGKDIESFRAINLDVATDTEWHGYQADKWTQAEVMVKSHIPLSLITITEFGWKLGLQDQERIPLSRFAGRV